MLMNEKFESPAVRQTESGFVDVRMSPQTKFLVLEGKGTRGAK